MTTFILILTMGYQGYSVAMTSVPGFQSSAECTSAGQAWMQEGMAHTPGKYSFVCVEQKK